MKTLIRCFGYGAAQKAKQRIITAVVLVLPLVTPAAVRVWNGSYSGNWSAAQNWDGNKAPVNGDELVFPPGALNPINTNNNAVTTVHSITFTGSNYVLRGSGVTVASGINASHISGTNQLDLNLALGGAQTFSCTNPGASLVTANINNAGFGLVFSGAGNFVVNGIISGSGDVSKSGLGTLTYRGPRNEYTGTTRVNQGLLALECVAYNDAFRGPLVIGDGTHSAIVRLTKWNQQLPTNQPVTINMNGLLDLNNLDDVIGGLLTLQGGEINSGAGKLTIRSNLVALSSSATAYVSGRLDLDGRVCTIDVADGPANPELVISAVITNGGIIKNGHGNVEFRGGNTYAGLTIINDGFIMVRNPAGLGSTVVGTVLNGGNLSLARVAIADEPLTNNSADSIFQADDGASWSGTIMLNADMEVQVLGETLDLSGVIRGNGGICKSQGGTLRFSGASANTFRGAVKIYGGTLELAKSGSAVALLNNSALIIGDGIGGKHADVVRYVGPGASQINATVPIAINWSGLLDLNGFDDQVGSLTFSGGDLVTGAGTAVLMGDITVNPNTNSASEISGRLRLPATRTITIPTLGMIPDLKILAEITGPGDLVFNGAGVLGLYASNSFDGTFTINGGAVRIANAWALGSTNGGTIVNSNGALLIWGDRFAGPPAQTNIHVGLEPLTLNSSGGFWALGPLSALDFSNSWQGPIALQKDALLYIDTPATLNLASGISGSGKIFKAGAGTLIFSGNTPNTYTNTTYIWGGTLVLAKSALNEAIIGPVVIGDGTGGPNADVLRLAASTQIANDVPVVINSSGLFDLAGEGEAVGSIAGSGNINLGSGYLNVGFDNSSNVFSGSITGVGGRLNKYGTGTLTLNGTNTYTGETHVGAGTLIVNGAQPASPVSVSTGAALCGTGIVGHLTVAGSVRPGTSPGTLTSSNAAFGAGSHFEVELNGPTPGVEYDQLTVRGTVNLTNPVLNVTTRFTQPVGVGDQLRIINNDGSDVVVGQFAGWPEGTSWVHAGFKLVLSYVGGDGNDVVFTVAQVPAALRTVSLTAGNGNGIIEPNECNNLDIVITNQSTATMTNVIGVLSTITPGVVISQPYSTYPDVAPNSLATNNAPYQISTLPNFVGGTNILLNLTIFSASHGAFTLPFALTTRAGGGNGACDYCLATITGEITPDDNRQTNRVSRNGLVASCGWRKMFEIGAFGTNFHYDAYTFTNTTGADACVTVVLESLYDLLAVMYLESFDPTDISKNYLGDAGYSTAQAGGQIAFSCTVPAGARFVVTVNDVAPVSAAYPYNLHLSGLPCPEPTLGIELVQTNRVRIHWPSWAGGYKLQATPVIAPASWVLVTNEPVVFSGRYNVTNVVTPITNRFYRLHRP